MIGAIIKPAVPEALAPQRKSGLIPREHGAWAMLLQPFIAALIIYHRWNWEILPALAAVILVFLARDPLTVLARQKWVWKTEHPETQTAKRYLAIELPLLAVVGAALSMHWPLWILGLLGIGAAGLTSLAVLMTVKNRQRTVWLQALSAAGLSSSALAACLAISTSLPVWVWWLWALHAAHFLAAILVVHTRLEARIAYRKFGPELTPAFHEMRRQAGAVQVVLGMAAATLFADGRALYGTALALSALFHLLDLYNQHASWSLEVRMKIVGQLALTLSILFTLLVIGGSL